MEDIEENKEEKVVEDNYIGFRADKAMLAALDAANESNSRGLTAREQLEFHFRALADDLASVTFTEAEASLIVDALNGILTTPDSARLLWAEIAKAIRSDGLDRKWRVDGAALVAKLQNLSYGQAMAVAMAARRFWNDPNPRDKKLRAVGLVREG